MKSGDDDICIGNDIDVTEDIIKISRLASISAFSFADAGVSWSP